MGRHCQKRDCESAKVSGVLRLSNLTRKTNQIEHEIVGKLYVTQAAGLQVLPPAACARPFITEVAMRLTAVPHM